MKNILVLSGSHHLHDRSWECKTEMEAAMMARWLRDNRVEIEIYDNANWLKLPHYEDEALNSGEV
jgi:flavodoxin